MSSKWCRFPERGAPSFDWLRWPAIGALVAGPLLLFMSVGIEPSHCELVCPFGSYNETYGSLATVVVLLMWFFLSAYAVPVGAESTALL